MSAEVEPDRESWSARVGRRVPRRSDLLRQVYFADGLLRALPAAAVLPE
ncbi:unnamed protein product, partial [Tetraodon nigroviridis]